MWDHPVSLISVYAGFYLAIVFLSLSIGAITLLERVSHPRKQGFAADWGAGPTRARAC